MAEYDFKALESLIAEVRKFADPAKEPTLFAVGGRGYYENPASDLLAFFLKPDAKHELGDLFLSTFLECMKVDHRQLDLNHVNIEREERTQEQNRIDLQILGTDWCLLIENKIYHWEANPFATYEDHANRLGKKVKLYAVLSPSGHIKKEGKKEDWKGVSYSDYCKALRLKLPEIDSFETRSKWRLFAREFILHLENELNNPPMTSEQASFVETHATGLIEAQKLLQQYPAYLCSAVKEGIEKQLGYPVEVSSGWAIIIKAPERWGNAWVALRPPTELDRGDRSPDSLFDMSIYPDEGDLKRGQSHATQIDLLKDMRHLAKHGCWVTTKGFKDCSEALKFLVERIKLVERPVTS